MTGAARGALEMIIAMSISGTVGWFVLISGVPAGQIVFWRCAFGALVLGGACLASGVSPWQLRARQLWLILGSGTAVVASWLLLFSAFARTGIAVATILHNTQPFMLVILGRLFLGETLTPGRMAWLGLGFAGLVMVVAHGLASIGGSGSPIGMAMAVGAALCWAAASLQTKLLSDVPPRLIGFMHTLIGAAILAPIGLKEFDASWPIGWAMLATMGAVHTGLVFILLYSAIHRLPTHMQGALAYIYPAVAILVDIVAFDHRATWLELGGVATILLAAGGMARLHAPVLAALSRPRRPARSALEAADAGAD